MTMNVHTKDKILTVAAISFCFFAVVGLMFLAATTLAEKDEERRALENARTNNLIQQWGCKRTGFVGKDAEGVYLCAGGNMYKYSELFYTANPR